VKDFEGNVLIIETPDGGDAALEDGVIKPDPAFSTAVYLSLFGGNKDDAGKVRTGAAWWGNSLRGLEPHEDMTSRFQHIIRALPMTVKNIRAAEDAARLDLAWLIEEGIADEITATGISEGAKRFRLEARVNKSGAELYAGDYGLLWEGCINGGV
jgi:phage gp46-like protein